MTFDAFFARAAGSSPGKASSEPRTPFPYQRRLAESATWPARLEIPTGLGKTLAITVAWLYRRQHPEFRLQTSRRLVYCLPMRTLVDQTHEVVRQVVANLGAATRVVVLMGGIDDDTGWDIRPEDDAIIIGTQDMLLSRALNRGYGMSRYRWPLHFALLNNDCLWVIDEVQLVGVGVATTAQLQAFRRKLGAFGITRTTWVSATLDEKWVRTVDVEDVDVECVEKLDDNDRRNAVVAQRLGARKSLGTATSGAGETKALAVTVARTHRPGTRTIVIVNTVDRAQELYRELLKTKTKAAVVLLHSRYRLPDRRRQLEVALAPPLDAGTIVVSTQVIEAGVDVSSSTLFTEAAPWASLVQRFGRCNRAGEDHDAQVILIPIAANEDKLAKPYALDDVLDAQQRLAGLSDVGVSNLPMAPMKLEAGDVLRRPDLLDLFDTTRDLLGDDVDVSRYIRDSEDRDVQIYWRTWMGTKPGWEERRPHRDELCTAPLAVIHDWHKAGRALWRFDPIRREMVQLDPRERARPGQVLLLASDAGGYDPRQGLDRTHKGAVPVIALAEDDRHVDDDHDGDPEAQVGRWYLLSDHSEDVHREAVSLGASLKLPNDLARAIADAGRWHDAGKAHPVWQTAIRALAASPPEGLLAKSASDGGRITFERPGFRHELASALLALAHGESDLVVFLIAAHHGKVRLVLRPAPHERPPKDGRPFARGVHDGDALPAIDLGAKMVPPATLSLDCMRIGRGADGSPSWLDRMLRLRDHHGPFRLAFLEALVKCADERASERIVRREP